MKSKIILSCMMAAITGFVFLVSGCASTGPLAAKEANYPKDQVDAHGLFTENCATCHGENGRARTFHGRLVGAQNLTDEMWQDATTDQQIMDAIRTGPRAMPAFAKKLSPSEIEALKNYVRTLKSAPQGK